MQNEVRARIYDTEKDWWLCNSDRPKKSGMRHEKLLGLPKKKKKAQGPQNS
jgi:hypothetical protein